MNTINREELKNHLDRSEPVQLVMALNHWAFDQAHIPGSVPLNDILKMNGSLRKDREVVVYCTNASCPAGFRTYYLLRSLGYKNISLYEGGLEDWVTAGYPVESSLTRELQWAFI